MQSVPMNAALKSVSHTQCVWVAEGKARLRLPDFNSMFVPDQIENGPANDAAASRRLHPNQVHMMLDHIGYEMRLQLS